MAELQNAVLAHNFAYANQVAEKIGLTEEKLVARGGGKAGITSGILLVLVLYALLSEGHKTPATGADSSPAAAHANRANPGRRHGLRSAGAGYPADAIAFVAAPATKGAAISPRAAASKRCR